MIDYILVNNKYRISVNDVKVIPGEKIMSQHYLLLMDMVLKEKVRKKFRKKFQKIEKEIEIAEVERVRGERRVC